MWPRAGAAQGREEPGEPKAELSLRRSEKDDSEAGLRKAMRQAGPASLLTSQGESRAKGTLGLSQSLRPPWLSQPALPHRRQGWPLIVQTGLTKDSSTKSTPRLAGLLLLAWLPLSSESQLKPTSS